MSPTTLSLAALLLFSLAVMMHAYYQTIHTLSQRSSSYIHIKLKTYTSVQMDRYPNEDWYYYCSKTKNTNLTTLSISLPFFLFSNITSFHAALLMVLCRKMIPFLPRPPFLLQAPLLLSERTSHGPHVKTCNSLH